MRHLLLILLLFFCTSTRAQVNLNSGLVLYLPFNGNTNDASGNGNNAVNYGATLTTDQWGNANSAYYFDGASFMKIANNASLQPNTAITLAAKVKVQGFYNGTCYNNSIIDKGADFVPGFYNLRFQYLNGNCYLTDSTHDNYVGGFYNQNVSAAAGYNAPFIQKNQWDCLVFTYDGTIAKMYVNGVLRHQFTSTSSIGTNNSDVLLGKHNDPSYPYWFKGVMDEVRIYNRALNTQEVDSLCSYQYVAAAPDTVINKYAAVTSRIPCSSTITVDDATDFNVGDTVLMIQMKGAQFDSTNTAGFGNILNYNGAGNYEYNVIKAKAGNTITFKYKIAKFYDIPNGKVQIVRVPYFQKYTVNQPHTCMPWNGSKGGVFVVNVADSFKLNDKIDVSGKGFKGGQINNGTAYTCNLPDYYYPSNTNNGGIKGEGIAEISASKIRGRGKLTNGGGGGNSTNAGGAGGGNGGAGGKGGRQWVSCDTTVDYGGVGGMALTYANRLFQGGGGGCGHENNGDTDPAGNGGGIVIINTLNFSGNNQLIKANGDNCIDNLSLPPSSGDGQSGGGAGGAILIKATNIASNPSIEAKGGNGGNVYVVDPHGPGGGGGGGAVLFAGTSVPSTAINVNGGSNGVITFNSNPHFATSGQTGLITSGYSLTFPAVTDTFKPNQISVNFTDSVVSCYTRKMKDSVSVITSPIYSYYWDFGGGNTSTLKNPTYTFPGYGSFPVKLMVIDSSGCKDSITKNVVIPYTHFANAGKDTSTCLGVPVSLIASGGVSYLWSPTTGLGSPQSATTTASINATTDYVVTVTNNQGCIDKDTVRVTLVPSPPLTVSPDTTVCKGATITLRVSGGSDFTWTPRYAFTNPDVANPTTVITEPGSFEVTGKAFNGCISSATVYVDTLPGPAITITSDIANLDCKHNSMQLFAGGAVSYQWQPAQYCDNATLASPVVTPPTDMLFTVTGTDINGCSGTASFNVATNFELGVFVPSAFSPNGDFINDRIRPIVYCDFIFEEFRIFDRFGENVFTSCQIENSWDGYFKGTPIPVGVYFYFVKGKRRNGDDAIIKGDITLIR